MSLQPVCGTMPGVLCEEQVAIAFLASPSGGWLPAKDAVLCESPQLQAWHADMFRVKAKVVVQARDEGGSV